jgi:hypothetical protein
MVSAANILFVGDVDSLLWFYRYVVGINLLTLMFKFISQCHVKHIMMETIIPVLKVSKYIVTSITNSS